MSYGDEFLLPGLFDNLALGDESDLHQAGFDYSGIAQDQRDIFPDDFVLTPDNPPGEQLPQFGPPFVRYVHDRFTRMDRLMAKMLARWSYEPTTVVIFGAMNADANGNINRSITPNAILYEPPPGFTLALHRLTISAGGNNFGTPFTVAAGYWELRVNDEMLDGGSLVSGAGSFPVARTWGTRDALRVRDGEVLSLLVSGTNTFAGKVVTVRGQGTLERQAES